MAPGESFMATATSPPSTTGAVSPTFGNGKYLASSPTLAPDSTAVTATKSASMTMAASSWP